MRNSRGHGPPGGLHASHVAQRQRRAQAAPRWALLALVASVVAAVLAACAGGGVPAAPSEVSVTPVAGGLRVDWTSDGTGVTGFKIYRETAETEAARAGGGLAPQTLAEIATAPGDARRYYDFSVEQTESYTYAVSALGAGGESAVTRQSDPEPVTPLPGVEVSIEMVGTGTVTASGGGEVFECAQACVAAFAHGTEVRLEAAGSGGQSFATWLEDCSGAGACTFTLDEPRAVVAAFSSNVLRLVLDGDSPVDVAVSPGHGGQGSAVCELGPGGSCGFGYPAPVGVSVNVTLLEAEGRFTGFGSVCTAPQGRYCVVNSSGGLTELSIGAVRPPVAGAESYDLFEDRPLDVDAEDGVLANDVDSPWDTLTAVLVTDVEHGQLILEADGGFSYSPAPDFNGSDGFEYRARDAYGNESDVVLVGLSVAAVNDPPSFQIAADPPPYGDGIRLPVEIPGFASGISRGGGPDEAGQAVAFTVTRIGLEGPVFLQAPAIDPSGTLTFQHQPGTTGTATFEVVLKDDGGVANGGSDTSPPQTFTITANPTPRRSLSVALAGSGLATVTSTPVGVGCGGQFTAVPRTCAGISDIFDGAVFTLTAVEGVGPFMGWSGACTGTALTCVVTMDDNKSVVAHFTTSP